jgi:hypothetical protein
MTTVKTIGSSGQIALGKAYAGRQVLVSEVEPGVWVIKLGEFIPEGERWLHEPRVATSLDKAIAWAEKNPPRVTDLKKLAARIRKRKQ